MKFGSHCLIQIFEMIIFVDVEFIFVGIHFEGGLKLVCGSFGTLMGWNIRCYVVRQNLFLLDAYVLFSVSQWHTFLLVYRIRFCSYESNHHHNYNYYRFPTKNAPQKPKRKFDNDDPFFVVSEIRLTQKLYTKISCNCNNINTSSTHINIISNNNNYGQLNTSIQPKCSATRWQLIKSCLLISWNVIILQIKSNLPLCTMCKLSRWHQTICVYGKYIWFGSIIFNPIHIHIHIAIELTTHKTRKKVWDLIKLKKNFWLARIEQFKLSN